MPNIAPEHRPALDHPVHCLSVKIRRLSMRNRKGIAGFTNYAVTRLLMELLGVTDSSAQPPVGSYNYDRINEAIGMLECCKLELYRVLVGPYEDTKIAENGVVLAPRVEGEPLAAEKTQLSTCPRCHGRTFYKLFNEDFHPVGWGCSACHLYCEISYEH